MGWLPLAISSGGGFTPTSTQSANFLARATGITLTADKTNYDTLITGIVTDLGGNTSLSTWPKLDVLYIFAAPTATTARLNLISSSFTATETGTVTFSAYNGFTGNGTTGFENSNFTPPSAGGNFTRDLASFGAYILATSLAAGDNTVSIGTYDGVGTLSDLIDLTSGGSALVRLNDTGGGSTTYAGGGIRAGMYLNSRTGASAEAFYKNGVSKATSVNASQSIASLPSFYILARDDNGTASSFSTDQVSAAFIGGALTPTDATNLSTRINNFMAALASPINVY